MAMVAEKESTAPSHPLAAPPGEDALKRNTDCVYFLASPLTCKKGSECEYRHSEHARMNPRDCWYWLNGNCLNPKCSFRHPPLDGLLGNQATTPTAGSSIPKLQAVVPPVSQVPGNSCGKQSVPCIFFQKGLCLKGDRCAFLHGPNHSANKMPQAAAATPVTEPPSLKKVFGGLEKCSKEQKVLQPNLVKSFEVPRPARLATKIETAPPKHEVSVDKTAVTSASLRDELPRYKATDAPPVTNGNTSNRSNRMHHSDVSDDHSFPNAGKDADEFYRESSPGFDVLVDDDLRDSNYYHDEDRFRGDRNLNSMNEFDISRATDYNSMADLDREMFHGPHGFDSYEHMHGQYAWDTRRSSSERMVGASPLERRGYGKSESPDVIKESDLRHRLSKQRRVTNGLRSIVSHDYGLDNQNLRGTSRREDPNQASTHESSFGGRLRGRIKLPRRSSPVNGSDFHAEKDMDMDMDMDRGRNRGRLSPGRQQIPSQLGRLRDRIRGRVQEDSITDARNSRNQRIRRDIVIDGSADFAGPKSLAELKIVKNIENREQRTKVEQSLALGKPRNSKTEVHQQSEGDLSFEGPKPLSLILKRKRGAETTVSGHENKEENNPQGGKDASKTTETNAVESVEDGLIPTDKNQAADNKSSQVPSPNGLETEEGIIGDGETEGDQNLEREGFDQRDGDVEGEGEYEYEEGEGEYEYEEGGEYEYEEGDEGEYNLEEGENADPEAAEYMDEDGDDFSKKLGRLC